MENKKRLFLLLFLLGLAISLLAYKLLSSPPIEIIEFINGKIVESPYPFYYQDTEHPKAQLLRAKVEPAIEGISSEWKKLIAIRKWVKNQWEHGEAKSSPVDALEILRRVEQGERFWCGHYARAYIQALASFGFVARIVELYTNIDNRSNSHAVTEVWSNDYNKWVVMDVDYNCYYTKEGIPLSALELHNAFLEGETGSIEIERSGAITSPDPYSTPEHLLNYYDHLLFVFRNDLLTLEIPKGSQRIHAYCPQWVDAKTPPLTFYLLKTNQTSDIYYTLNQVEIGLSYQKSFHPKQNSVKVQLTHNVPNFDRYLVRINQTGDWEEGTSPFEWRIKKGLNTLEVKARNRAGADGPISRVVLRLD
ncbi:transglutaminase domain-containing protein [bacterium]|nr:transglutaminase domain-containing protein [bacterium]